MFPRSLGQISRPCSTSILRFVFCTTASDLPVCFQTIAVHCWQSDNFKLSALLVCWLKIRQPSPFRQLGHNWVSQGWSAHLNTAPSLSSIPLFNTLQMKDFCNCCRSKAWKSWPFNNSLKKVSERVRQDGGVLSKLKNWMEKWKWFSGGTSTGGRDGKKNWYSGIEIYCSHIIQRLRLFRRCYSLVDHSSQKQETVSIIQQAKF